MSGDGLPGERFVEGDNYDHFMCPNCLYVNRKRVCDKATIRCRKCGEVFYKDGSCVG